MGRCMAKKKTPVAVAADGAVAVNRADPALARLPAESIEPLKQALQCGRYILVVVRFDADKQKLELYRHVRDIPRAEHEIILSLLRESLQNGG